MYNQRTSLIIFWSIFCKITLNFFFPFNQTDYLQNVLLSLTCNQEYKKSLVVYVFKSFSLIQSTRQHMYACWHHPRTTFQETSYTVSHNFIKLKSNGMLVEMIILIFYWEVFVSKNCLSVVYKFISYTQQFLGQTGEGNRVKHWQFLQGLSMLMYAFHGVSFYSLISFTTKSG